MNILYCKRGGAFQYTQRVLIRLGVIFFMALTSACGNEESRSYIPPEMEKCVDYTRQVIERRQENYWRYTDRTLEDGEAVWVAGRRLDFDQVMPEPGEHKPTFISSDAWVRKGEYLPGITAIYRDSVAHMRDSMSGVILSDIDQGDPKIIIKLDCMMGVAPSVERYVPIDWLVSKLPGGAAEYAVSLNKGLGFYQALSKGKHVYDYFYMHRDGIADISFPSIFCEQGNLSGNCSASVAAWDNIVLRYRFPRRQLGDFTRIYQATKEKIDVALEKGEQ